MTHRLLGQLQYVLLLATGLLILMFFQTRTDDLESHNQRVALIDQVLQIEGELDRNALMTTAFLLNQYDPFVELDRRLRETLEQLQREHDAMRSATATELFNTRLVTYRELLSEKLHLLERLKSRAALVRNGLHYLPSQTQRIQEELPEVSESLVQLVNRLLQFNLLPGKFAVDDIRQGITRLEGRANYAGTQARDLDNLLSHVRLVLQYVSQLQEMRERYMAAPTYLELVRIRDDYNAYYMKQTRLANIFSYVLLVLAVVLFAGLGYAMRKAHQAQRESDRSRKQLHDAVASLSETFALFDAEGQLVLCNDRYRETYPWLDTSGPDSLFLSDVAEANLRHRVKTSGDDPCNEGARCGGRSSYTEELPDGRWIQTSDTCTDAGEFVRVGVDITEIKRNEAQLRKLYRALEQSPASVVITDTEGNIEYVNPKFEEITGYTEEEALGQNPRMLKSGDKTPEEYAELWETILSGRVWRGQFHNKRKDGEIYWESASISPVRDEVGNISHFIAVKEDVTSRKRAEDQLRMNATVFETTTEAIMVTDERNVIKSVNPAFTRITGFEPEEVIGRNPSILSSGRHDEQFYREMWQSLRKRGYWSGEIWNRRKDGSVFPEWLSLALIHDEQGEIKEHVAVFSDISQRKKDEEQIRRQANYDALTGLPNRSLLVDRLDSSLKSASRENWRVALLFVDLDRFKEVNDSLGHVVGDELLQQVAERLRSCLREADTVARFGGDEFVIVLEDIDRAEEVAEVAKKILQAVCQPFELSGRDVFVGASIGITIYPDDTDDADTMLRHADMAMYRAKDAGRNNYQFFTVSMNEHVQHRIELERDLRQALERDQLELYYQPLVRLADHRMIGVEALIRWRHPELGMVPPDRFIPLAEETGLIDTIGRWVLHTACEQCAAWQREGMELKVNVNLSSRQLLLGLEVSEVDEVLRKHDLSPQHLHLEITEGLMMEGTDSTLKWLQDVRDLGVCLAVDDFGTGYSSLSYLKRFPMNSLKIDREFVRDLPQDQGDATLVQAIIAMANSLGLEVVAEGVETVEQLDFLRGAGCTFVQGYFIGKPMPADEIAGFVSEFAAQD